MEYSLPLSAPPSPPRFSCAGQDVYFSSALTSPLQGRTFRAGRSCGSVRGPCGSGAAGAPQPRVRAGRTRARCPRDSQARTCPSTVHTQAYGGLCPQIVGNRRSGTPAVPNKGKLRRLNGKHRPSNHRWEPTGLLGTTTQWNSGGYRHTPDGPRAPAVLIGRCIRPWHRAASDPRSARVARGVTLNGAPAGGSWGDLGSQGGLAVAAAAAALTRLRTVRLEYNNISGLGYS
jgi:hypothetical protein